MVNLGFVAQVIIFPCLPCFETISRCLLFFLFLTGFFVNLDMNFFDRLAATVIGAGIGHLIGSNHGETEEERKLNAKKGRWIGGSLAFGGSFLMEEKADTVNYTLYHKGVRVYDGLTSEDRLEKRVAEHKRDGKLFDEVQYDGPVDKERAIKLEQYRIKRFKPQYNIHHNR